MVKWDEEHKLKMLLAIIEHLNPTSLPWDKLASAMGPEFTSEAVRGQYKSIKKGFKPTPGGATTTSTPSSSSKTKTKTKTKTKQPTTTAKAKTTTTKNRKRKAAEASLSDDDDANDEDKETALKSSSDLVKNENGIKGGGGVIVKTEQGDEGTDLENDDLYDAA